MTIKEKVYAQLTEEQKDFIEERLLKSAYASQRGFTEMVSRCDGMASGYLMALASAGVLNSKDVTDFIIEVIEC